MMTLHDIIYIHVCVSVPMSPWFINDVGNGFEMENKQKPILVIDPHFLIFF